MWLITPTLLNAFDYYFNFEGEGSGEGDEYIPPEQKEAQARTEFLQMLSREKFAPNENMQAGIDFENRVHAYCKGAPDEDPVITEIGDIVKGGIWQQSMKMELGDFLLYARGDVVKRDTIFDLKRSKSYEVGKYQPSMQHRIELLCSGMPKFSYLISDDRSWWREDYANHAGIEQEVSQAIRRFTGYLANDTEASALYRNKWVALEALAA